jgi:hypothetical protein
LTGLLNAFFQTGTTAYKTAATSAGHYIVNYETSLGSGTPNYIGDEAYALTRLSALAGDSSYAASVKTFYDSTVRGSTSGTAGYISRLEGSYSEHSQPTFYLAFHTLAAYATNVNALDKQAWRNATVQELGTVTNSDDFPVEAVGAALFAIASTGPLDSTLVKPGAANGSFWFGVKLSDLPGIVARQQVTAGAETGAFNYQLDTTAGGTGLAEDAAFATLGLEAAFQSNPVLYNYGTAITSAVSALSQGITNGAGAVHQDMYDTSSPHTNYYNGEVLEAIPEPVGMGALAVGAMFLARRKKRISR